MLSGRLFLLALLFLGSFSGASAKSYTFSKIVDTSAEFTGVVARSINEQGVVAFVAIQRGGQSLNIGNGTSVTKIADTSESFALFFNAPVINDHGDVVFDTVEDSGDAAIYVYADGDLTRVAASGPLDQGGVYFPFINNNRQVAFIGTRGIGTTLFTADNGSISHFPIEYPLGFGFGMNDLGTITWSSVPGLYRAPFEGPAELVIPSRETWTGFLIQPTINNADVIAAAASKIDNAVGDIGDLITVHDGSPSVVIDGAGAYSSFRQAAINDKGEIAFGASFDDFGILFSGIYTGPEPVEDKVIHTGDPLFDSTAQEVFLLTDGFNNRGQVAFMYTLANGVSGIAVANPGSSGRPTITIGSAANGASYLPGIVSGSWAQIKGDSLSPTTRIWSANDFGADGRLPTMLDGVEVKVDGQLAPVYYISPSQISFQVRENISGQVTVSVLVNGTESNSITAMAVDSAPGVFGYAAGIKTYSAAIFAASGVIVGDPAISGSGVRKAVPGDQIALYATALTPSPAGIPVSTMPVGDVTAEIGSTRAPVSFAGLVSPGLFQINITVPDLSPGDYAVRIRVNDKTSQEGILIPIAR